MDAGCVAARLNILLFGLAVFASAFFAQSGWAAAGGKAETSTDGHGAYATGHYRNLFAEAGHSPEEISAKIQNAYQKLFHGDPQSETVFFSAGSNANGALAYLTDWNNHDVRTEGMSYGMMIAVQLNKKPEFDA